MIVWSDVETTDLDEKEGFLLEVAFVATDDQLVERAHTSIVMKPVGIEIDDVSMPLVVREMHEKSGLLDDVRRTNWQRHQAEEWLTKWFADTFGRVEDLRQVPLAGSTIDFDRRWLRYHMQSLEALFHYRSINVSSLTELAMRWAPEIYNNRPKLDKKHRALDDVRESIAYLRYYRERGFVGGGEMSVQSARSANRDAKVCLSRAFEDMKKFMKMFSPPGAVWPETIIGKKDVK